MEFYMYISMFLLFLAVIMIVLLNLSSTEVGKYDSYTIEETAGMFADIIHSSYVAGNGFNGSFKVPTDIDGLNYTTYFTNGYVIVTQHGTKNLTAVRPLVTEDIINATGHTAFSYTSREMSGRIYVLNNLGQLNITS